MLRYFYVNFGIASFGYCFRLLDQVSRIYAGPVSSLCVEIRYKLQKHDCKVDNVFVNEVRMFLFFSASTAVRLVELSWQEASSMRVFSQTWAQIIKTKTYAP